MIKINLLKRNYNPDNVSLKDVMKRLDRIDKNYQELRSDIDKNYQELRSEIANQKAESYKREFEIMRGEFFRGFRPQAAPPCVGNSPTNPDYDIFLDEDYGL